MSTSQRSKIPDSEHLHTAFFYGTLMHPKILKRVLGNDGSHLKICAAVLLDHTRHNVIYADYPGVLPYNLSKDKFDRELSWEERSVRGTLVTGLTAKDVRALDHFEGGEYAREKVAPHPLDAFVVVSSQTDAGGDGLLVPSHPPPLPNVSDLLPPIEAETYIYKDVRGLAAELWSYEDFVRKNAWKWYRY